MWNSCISGMGGPIDMEQKGWDRMLDQLCNLELWPHPWPWPWIFSIDIEWKGYVAVGWWTTMWPWTMTMTWIFKVKFWNSHIWRMGGPIDMKCNGQELIGCWTPFVTLNFDLTHDPNFEIAACYVGIGGSIDKEWKEYESIGWWTTIGCTALLMT